MPTPQDPNLPDVSDTPGQFLSFSIPTTGVEYNYLRLGKADTANENLLPANTSAPSGTVGGTTYAPGVLIYSTDGVVTTAPQVTTITPQSLGVTINNSGDRMYAATMTSTSGVFGGEPSTVAFNNIDSLTMALNMSSTFITGQALTSWLGNDQSIGFGGLLWANYGITTNLFGGSILNITNWSMEIQGFGEYKMTTSHQVDASSEISFMINPVAASTPATVITALFTTVMVAVTAAANASTTTFTIKARVADGTDTAAVTTLMQNAQTDMQAATALIDGVQGLSVLAGAIMKGAQVARKAMSQLNVNVAPGLTITPATTALRGVATTVEATTTLDIAALGPVEITSGASAVTVTPVSITCSASGNTAIVSAAGVTLTAGGNSIAVSAAGIAINGTQLNNIAALINLYA